MTMERRDLPYTFCKQNRIYVEHTSETPAVIATDATQLSAISEVQRVMGQSLDIKLIPEVDFEQQLNVAYQQRQKSADHLAGGLPTDDLEELAEHFSTQNDLLSEGDNSPLVNFINAILSGAIRANASDIHIESSDDRLIIRYRIDGVLRKVASPSATIAPTLISRIKILSKLDIAEKRVPQDGRMSLRLAGQDIDVRVSTLPATQSERVVLRILDKHRSLLTLDQIGLAATDQAILNNALASAHGIILVTGPTGSGKTTTLYAGLSTINDEQKNILTIEDPVEYQVAGIGQTQHNPKAGFTFAKGLRAILRQDPDVIMVGEIRDTETLQIALQASLTGHLVLSTIHTNSAVSTITRLIDMGAEPFLISSSLLVVVSQRLVRKLCEHCKTPVSPQVRSAVEARYKRDLANIYRAVGCEQCGTSGYRGRIGLYEILPVDETVQRIIAQGGGELELTEYHERKNKTLFADGLEKASAGLTSVEEVLRVSRTKMLVTDE